MERTKQPLPKRKIKRRINYPAFAAAFALLALMIYGVSLLFRKTDDQPEQPVDTPVIVTEATEATTEATEPPTEPPMEYPAADADTFQINEEAVSSNVILIDLSEGRIVAEKDADTRIYPASLTKVMTLIVAVEALEDLSQTYTFSGELIDPLVMQNASRAGFLPGETVTMLDLLYGTVLPSGADATNALAEVVAGDEPAFATLMNQKAEAMGLKSTHFITCSGLHDAAHYSTVEDMALILEYALEMPLCREILSTYQYTTTATPQNPEGLLLESTMFARMYGDEVEGVQILGGKTGYTDEAGNCLASFAACNGKEYILVTAGADSRWQSVFDAFRVYDTFLMQDGQFDPSKSYGVNAEATE